MSKEPHKANAEPLAMVLLAIAALLCASILFEIAGFCVTCANAKSTVARATGANSGAPNNMDERMTEAKSLADQLKDKNLFVSKPPKQHPVKEVIGILGDEALINDKWYKAGDNVGDAKIVAVEPTMVRIVWEEQEKEFVPIGTSGSEGPAGRHPPMRSNRRRPTPSGASSVVISADPGARGSRPQGGPSFSPEERRQFRERWRNMTPEERERLRGEMHERFGRRSQ